ncbi:MAG: molybdenum cofactor guanylyltransferase MobA [Paracoccus sp. (in: a-proteobacteria)]|uniref:molybdenum cofactor guanylyltransferase MobA n=1 Tax=Paracoccus sp. TaxID=267 RepID=UPI0026E0378E|nr:molybdenum cofactor guanylyltransferase MobA [Paracoccus sp. (in: a-proteobacteria)]MDO5611789.1 molybdenum cofactor guanylyltransferase MobA [Paracoccus sp. (in: a-proteobacteria)]
MRDIPAMILAGGKSSRMGGGDKGLRLLAGRPMLAHVAARLRGQCGPLALNANGDPARFAGLGLPVLPDPVADQPGPLAGVLAAMDWAAGLGAVRVLTAAGDTPFLPGDLVQRLADDGGLALAASRDCGQLRVHPVLGLWPVALRDDLRAAIGAGQRRVQLWAESQGARLVIWDVAPGQGDPFFNVNRAEDLELAERRLN